MSRDNETNEHPSGWLSYRLNLMVLYEQVLGADPTARDDKIDALFKKTEYADLEQLPGFAQQWSDLNQIELRLFGLLDDAQLRERTLRKISQAHDLELPDYSLLTEKFQRLIDTGTPEDRKAFALALLSDMFVKYSHRFAAREKRGLVSKRLIFVGAILVGVPFGLLLVGTLISPFVDFVQRFAPSRWTDSELTAFFFVLYFGIIGAYFSRLARYANNMKRLTWNELDLGYSPGALYVRLLVGAIAAMILFFLMMGDILSGPLFLEGNFTMWAVDEVTGQTRAPLLPSDNFARLIVWCIVSGFSERFMPDRLTEVAASAEGTGNRQQ